MVVQCECLVLIPGMVLYKSVVLLLTHSRQFFYSDMKSYRCKRGLYIWIVPKTFDIDKSLYEQKRIKYGSVNFS